jgi:hypothetical protein
MRLHGQQMNKEKGCCLAIKSLLLSIGLPYAFFVQLGGETLIHEITGQLLGLAIRVQNLVHFTNHLIFKLGH